MIQFTKSQLEKVLNKIIIKFECSSKFDCIFNLNYKEDGSYFSTILSTYKINIGCSFLDCYKDNDFVLDKDAVDIVVNIFHEYQHALRNYEMYHNYQNTNQEIYVSSFTSAYLPYYYHKKHSMSPNELDAELYGILNAKEFFKEFFPDFDFENAIVERVNELFEDNCWYGPFSDSELKVVFSYDDIINYLKDWQKISYNYNPLQDISNDKNFSKTIESNLLNVNDNGILHYDRILKYIKDFKELSYEDNKIVEKFIKFSNDKIRQMEEKINGNCIYDDWRSR